jgi:hypothetical protein
LSLRNIGLKTKCYFTHTSLLLIIAASAISVSSCSLLFFSNQGSKIAIKPEKGIMQPGSTLQLEAMRTRSDGKTENVSGMAEWASSAPDILTVSDNGVVEARSPGVAAIGAVVEGESCSGMITVLDPESTPPPGSTPLPGLRNPGFEDPAYVDPNGIIFPGDPIADYIPEWSLAIGDIDGQYNIGINAFDDADAGSNYIYLGQENTGNANTVSMSASQDTSITVVQTSTFELRYKIIDFEGDSNHSKFEYPIRIVITVNDQDCYLFLRTSNSSGGGEKADKNTWKSANLPLSSLSLPIVDGHGNYQVQPGDVITRIAIEPMGKLWQIFIDHIDIVTY